VAQSYLTAAQWNSSGLKDGASALESAVDHAKTRENENCKKNESPYRPFSTVNDQVRVAKPTLNGMAQDRTTVEKLVQEIRSECSFLRARLRSIFRANEKVTVSHGVRHGRDLSDRTLVDSAVSLRAKEIPDRAYQRKSARVDNSLAAVVVLDQSASMAWGRDKLQNATKGVLAIVDALDALNCAVEAVGFRDGPYQSGDSGQYHRTNAIKIDVFKGFNERFCSIKHRFAAARAEGGTPMADGLQHGINSLQNRREGHRVIFVVTDGEPNTGHGAVIRRQIRLAREANVHVIGVGIGNEAAYVLQTFDDAVHVQDIKGLPSALIRKLNDIIDVRRVKVAGNNRKIATE
jgi:nitric oxide reductase activation protein